jgi:hypothetical protein
LGHHIGKPKILERGDPDRTTEEGIDLMVGEESSPRMDEKAPDKPERKEKPTEIGHDRGAIENLPSITGG